MIPMVGFDLIAFQTQKGVAFWSRAGDRITQIDIMPLMDERWLTSLQDMEAILSLPQQPSPDQSYPLSEGRVISGSLIRLTREQIERTVRGIELLLRIHHQVNNTPLYQRLTGASSMN